MQALTPINELSSFDDLFPFFAKRKEYYNIDRKENKENEEQFFKVYHDGGHYVASVLQMNAPNKAVKHEKTDLDAFVDGVYLIALKSDIKRRDLATFLKDAIIDEYGEIANLDEYVQNFLDRKVANLHKRLKLFRRKARLNKWTHFVTITYDNAKHDAQSFRQKLRKTLANFHTRRGWKYMGVFELAPETKRLHFHALMYIPQGEMVGTVEERKDYSTAQHKMQTTHENTFFADAFGRNDFAELSEFEIKNGNAIDYITKYLAKTNEKILYSRGIPSEIIMKLHYSDIATTMFDFVMKFVLFDDVVDYERDVLRKKYTYKQQTLFDCIAT